MKKLSALVLLFLVPFFGKSQCSGYSLVVTSNDATCFGFCDAFISASTSGGNGGDVFIIADGQGNNLNVGGSNIANNLCSGWYFISVQDNMGCFLGDSVYIDQPGELDIDYTSINLLCFGEDTGSIVIDTVYNFQGNFSQIAYFWSPNPNGMNGIGQDSIGGLTAGQYVLSINDQFGCSNTFDIDILQPAEFAFSEFGFEPCEGGMNGIVYMSAGGGTPDYDYTWTYLTTGGTSSNTTWGGLDYGCYEGMVMDANGCVIVDTLCLSCLGIEELSFEVSIYPNPTADYVIIGGDSKDLLDVRLTSINGSEVYSETNFTLGSLITMSDYPTGVYIIEISNQEEIGYYRLIKE